MSGPAAVFSKSTLGKRAACSLLATILLIGALYLPIWQMTLVAPQYPKGLRLIAYGTEITGDLREINIINHYIGMEHIDAVPAPEMSLYPLLIAGLIGSSWLALAHRRLAQLAGWLAGWLSRSRGHRAGASANRSPRFGRLPGASK